MRRGPLDASVRAGDGDELQLFALPAHRRPVGLLRAGHGDHRGGSGRHRVLCVGRPDAADGALQVVRHRHTHWEPLERTPGARHGVNLRNFDPALLESVVIGRFDGADTWEFLD